MPNKDVDDTKTLEYQNYENIDSCIDCPAKRAERAGADQSSLPPRLVLH